jgi:hypothetical protein
MDIDNLKKDLHDLFCKYNIDGIFSEFIDDGVIIKDNDGIFYILDTKGKIISIEIDR